MKKQYFVMVLENNVWRKMPAPAPTVTDADTIAKNILAVKKSVTKVNVVSYDAKGVMQTHREYSKNPKKRAATVKKPATRRVKKNPEEIHIDINSHNAKKSAKAKTNPIPKSFNIAVQYKVHENKWSTFGYFDSQLTAEFVAKNLSESKSWNASAWRVVRL